MYAVWMLYNELKKRGDDASFYRMMNDVSKIERNGKPLDEDVLRLWRLAKRLWAMFDFNVATIKSRLLQSELRGYLRVGEFALCVERQAFLYPEIAEELEREIGFLLEEGKASLESQTWRAEYLGKSNSVNRVGVDLFDANDLGVVYIGQLRVARLRVLPPIGEENYHRLSISGGDVDGVSVDGHELSSVDNSSYELELPFLRGGFEPIVNLKILSKDGEGRILSFDIEEKSI